MNINNKNRYIHELRRTVCREEGEWGAGTNAGNRGADMNKGQ